VEVPEVSVDEIKGWAEYYREKNRNRNCTLNLEYVIYLYDEHLQKDDKQEFIFHLFSANREQVEHAVKEQVEQTVEDACRRVVTKFLEEACLAVTASVPEWLKLRAEENEPQAEIKRRSTKLA
jgi:flagellar biosynthesis/type III secretory pathway protein FliH